MPPTPIAFGTSGWRGILGDDFTCFNLRRVTRAVARHFCRETLNRPPRIFVGFDTRFLSEHLALEVAAVLAAEGVKPVLATAFTPTPALAHTVIHRKFDGGINLTASHNPAEYSGMKLSTGDGAPATTEITRRVEALLNEIRDGSAPPPLHASKVKTFDPAPDYRKAVLKHVRSKIIARGKLKLVCDPVNGTGSGYLPPLLAPAKSLFTIRDQRDVTFGGHSPDCTEKQLSPLIREVRRRHAHLGLATDGDADRFGVVDQGGRFVPANWVLALIADYLLETREARLGIARTVATTRLLDDVAATHSVPLFETPVGFKHFRDLLVDGKALVACEESSGLSVAGHIPEKDGLLAACLVAEMVAYRRKPLHRLIEDLFRKTGPRYSRREDHRLNPEQTDEFRARMESPPETLAGKRVVELHRKDGTFLGFQDGSWLLLRLSGTEPLARHYAEARNLRDVGRLLDAARAIIPAS
ncbi:MAG: phosphoglucomutase/phosphomannomutase family protein [Acidobacteria bacterium]|nr:phosphoglucomutase/phosphomannomutase family protein [Acidobacteriota bacterium]